MLASIKKGSVVRLIDLEYVDWMEDMKVLPIEGSWLASKMVKVMHN